MPYFGPTNNGPNNQAVLTALCSSITQTIYQTYSNLLPVRFVTANASVPAIDNPIRLSKQLLNRWESSFFAGGWDGPFQNLARMINNFWTNSSVLQSQWDGKNSDMQTFFDWVPNYITPVRNQVNRGMAANLTDLVNTLQSDTDKLYQLIQAITNDSAANTINSTNSQALATILSTLIDDYTSFSGLLSNITQSVTATIEVYTLVNGVQTSPTVNNNNSVQFLQFLSRVATNINTNYWNILNSQFNTASDNYVTLITRYFQTDTVVWSDWVNTYNKTHSDIVSNVNGQFQTINSTISDTTYNFGSGTNSTFSNVAAVIVEDIGSVR